MSRLSRIPLPVTSGVEVTMAGDGAVTLKGKLGSLTLQPNHNVSVSHEDGKLVVKRNRESIHARCLEGTYVRHLQNMMRGVSEGVSKTLELVGTGYRAKVNGRTINLELGFSHPVNYELPEGVEAETPAQNRIVLKGIDVQVVGQSAAEIRAKRPPEPYKGKGVRYENEQIITKETKKK